MNWGLLWSHGHLPHLQGDSTHRVRCCPILVTSSVTVLGRMWEAWGPLQPELDGLDLPQRTGDKPLGFLTSLQGGDRPERRPWLAQCLRGRKSLCDSGQAKRWPCLWTGEMREEAPPLWRRFRVGAIPGSHGP